MKIGASYNGNGGCEFCVWAPLKKHVSVHLLSPAERVVPLQKDPSGYWRAVVAVCPPKTRYRFLIDDTIEWPDPASQRQPDGVHGVSEVIDHKEFAWTDSSWIGIPLHEYVMYEIHIGTFTPEGTFAAAARRVKELAGLGITAIELMPVCSFPGSRNWGYDGVYPFSVHEAYGGSEGLKSFVDACHRHKIAVVLDVVYNHLGPEGNYLSQFGPYFTRKYQTPWGDAINYDDRHSDGVRNFFIENALFWLKDYHVDALRLDAVHGIFDAGDPHILAAIVDAVDCYSVLQGRLFYLTAETDLNDTRLIRPGTAGGFGVTSQWNEDFHHCLHTLLTKEKNGHYADFGSIADIKKAYEEGFVYSGQYSAFRGKPHGTRSRDVPAQCFIVFAQNHDQIGNRAQGERLASLVSFEALKLAAGAVLLSPYVPLIFMGEEYAEGSPFLYFVSHTDDVLIGSVRDGRRRDMKAFAWQGEPCDPQAPETFHRSKLNWGLRYDGVHKTVLDFYSELIHLRKEIPALAVPGKEGLFVGVEAPKDVLTVRRSYGTSHVLFALNFEAQDSPLSIEMPGGEWRKRFDSAGMEWMGPGSYFPDEVNGKIDIVMRPLSFVLYERKGT